MTNNLIYGITVDIYEYGPVPSDARPSWLNEIKGTRYFRTKSERKDFVNKIEELFCKSCGGFNEDGTYEITDYARYGIVIDYENYFEEEYKPITDKRVRVC